MKKLDKKQYFKNEESERGSGVLMHISSLPGPYGIGSMGDKAREFTDFLERAGQSYWQVLPIGTTSFGDSPYTSFSSYAGNPYFIDLDYLVQEDLLTYEDIHQHIGHIDDHGKVDYGKLYQERYPLLKVAFKNFDSEDRGYFAFTEKHNYWLRDYALFMTLKEKHNGDKWNNWPNKYKFRDHDALDEFEIEHLDEINFYKFIQYKFFSQWRKLKKYVNKKHISIIGDLPIYLAEDSADVWANPDLFQLNQDLQPTYVSGVPPDGFSDDGQLWGNPIYDWEEHEATDYEFWINRVKFNLDIFDVIRLDHFRGFESFWLVPSNEETAKYGRWEQGPGLKLFDALFEELGPMRMIVEDLGYMTDEVYKLRETLGFPSMKVLQFAFNPDATSDYLPHNLSENTVIYTGTHDNDTIIGWLHHGNPHEIEFAKKYLNITEEETFNWGLIRGAMTSVSKLAIFQMQDLLFLGNEARMNCPGTLGQNWQWRMHEHAIHDDMVHYFRELTRMSGRIQENNDDEDDENT